MDKHSKVCVAAHKCNICNESFDGATLLENHFKRCKKTFKCKFWQKTFKCKFWQKTFQTKSEEDEHIKVKYSQQKEFKFDACSNMYSVETDLLQHIKMHTRPCLRKQKKTTKNELIQSKDTY